VSRADELREAVEDAFSVSQMQEHSGWNVVRREALAAIESKKRAVLSGQAGDRYLELCGFIAGAEFVLETQERLEETANALREG
jgi:hypothetical protein